MPRSALVRGLFAAGAFAAVTLVTGLIAYLSTFGAPAPFEVDDEGYLLISLDEFLDGGALYDSVYSQYGPFYYQLWGGIFGGLGIEVSHDAGRFATLVVWVLGAAFVGLATYRLTRSVWLGVGTQAVVFAALDTFDGQAMHPGALICVLLAALLLVATFVGRDRAPAPAALLGGLVAALFLVKVNVGGFALAALALAWVASAPDARRPLRAAVEAGFVLLPIVLMARELDDPDVRAYALHVAAAALGVVLALRTLAPDRPRRRAELGHFGAGFGGVLLSSLLLALAIGTSPTGLFEGVIGEPFRHADAYHVPLDLAAPVAWLDVAALAGAFAYWRAARRPGQVAGSDAFRSLASLAIGAALALSVINEGLTVGSLEPVSFPYRLSLLGFAWLALAPERGAVSAFGTRLLPALAVAQALHAFPVAGRSQIAWSSFLLAPVAALCLANGARGLARVLQAQRERRALTALALFAALGFGLLIADRALKRPYEARRDAYDITVPLGLPGSDEIRFSPAEAAQLRDVTAAIDDRCGSLLTYPGMNSFYLWAELEPPTGLNAGYWMGLLDPGQQREVIAAVRARTGLCLLRNRNLAAAWYASGGRPHGEAPLLAFMRHEFVPLASFGGFDLLRRGSVGQTGAGVESRR
jgi:hypothetical protein